MTEAYLPHVWEQYQMGRPVVDVNNITGTGGPDILRKRTRNIIVVRVYGQGVIAVVRRVRE
jgi:hypothetical protein